jgi:hypothetical protein
MKTLTVEVAGMVTTVVALAVGVSCCRDPIESVVRTLA